MRVSNAAGLAFSGGCGATYFSGGSWPRSLRRRSKSSAARRCARDSDVIADLTSFEDVGLGAAEHGLFETGGEEAGFEGVHAEQGVLGEGNAFHGEAFLDDREGVGIKAVLAGVLGSAGFALGGLGPVKRRPLARLAAKRLGEVGIRLKV